MSQSRCVIKLSRKIQCFGAPVTSSWHLRVKNMTQIPIFPKLTKNCRRVGVGVHGIRRPNFLKKKFIFRSFENSREMNAEIP